MNNVYGEVVVPPNTPTVVNGITVPERGGYSFKGLIIWAPVDTDVTIMFNLNKIGGGRVSCAVQTLFLDYSSSPFGMNPFDTITVLAVQDDALTPPGSYMIKSTLLFEQL